MRFNVIAVPLLLVSCPSIALATDYTYCAERVAFSDPTHQTRAPGNDWICELKPDVSGDRCPAAQQRACAGGTLPGPHDVPNGGVAWFWAQSTTSATDVRCTCGCFAPETLILGELGEMSIETLVEAARFQEVRVQVRDNLQDSKTFRNSDSLRANNFRVGPEEKPLVRFYLENGRQLNITVNHPILIIRNERQAMVRAEDVKRDDILLNDSGVATKIDRIERAKTTNSNNSVINFASLESNPAAHIVVAEGVQVGDNRWQMALEIQRSRLDSRNAEMPAFLDELSK